MRNWHFAHLDFSSQGAVRILMSLEPESTNAEVDKVMEKKR